MKDIRELLNIKYPIIQGAMANISTAPLVAAVSNAGGLGVIGTGAWDKERLLEEIKATKALTDKPFGVNIMLLSPFVDDIAQLVIDEQIKVVTTGAGSPGKYIDRWKEAGITVIPVVPSVALATRLEGMGADALICEGTEAGGHIGELTTMALVPQVVSKVNIPVVAAGGIGDGRGMLAAYALGAKGIQVGTAFLASTEVAIHDNYKEKIVKAKDTDTIVTGRTTGAPVRVIKNKMAKTYIKMEKEELSLEEREQLTLGSLRKAVFEGDMVNGSIMAGQIAGLISEVKPSKAIIEDIYNEFLVLRKGLCEDE